MWTISRDYSFSAAHRIEGHPKCGRLHGHNYKVRVTLFGYPDRNGMILDYGDLDKVVKPIIDGVLDHRYIISNQNEVACDEYGTIAAKQGHAARLNIEASTAELLAHWLFIIIRHDILAMYHEAWYEGFRMAIEVQETDKSFATYTEM
jgi:6-pyruvoyl tetrahydropterin synthase/QueD family protein